MIISTVSAQFDQYDINLDNELGIVPVAKEQPEYGFPLPLMWLSPNHSIIVDYDNITEIFNQEEIAGRKIVAVSIIGALRKGKSFFLNYCLRFMYANVSKAKIDNRTND
jgi:hypothetical protein